MHRTIAPERYPDVRPLALLFRLAPILRRLHVLGYLIAALLILSLLGMAMPLTPWLIGVFGLAVPTIASMALVATD